MSVLQRRKRRSLAAVSLVAALSLSLAACSSDSPGESTPTEDGASGTIFDGAPVADEALFVDGSTAARIREAGVLKVGAALDAPLLSQQDPTDPDTIEGFDITLAKLLATYILGEPNVEVIPPATQTREALLQNGTVDVVFNTYTITEERAEQIQFAGPYFTSGLAVAVQESNTDITGIDDLDGRTVIVGDNTPAVEAVPEFAPNAELVAFGTDPQAVQALIQGRGDAYVQDYILLVTNANSNPEIKVVGEPFTAEPYGIGLGPDDPDFKEFVNNWLLEIQEGGQWLRAWQESIGTVVESEGPTPPEIGSVPGS